MKFWFLVSDWCRPLQMKIKTIVLKMTNRYKQDFYNFFKKK